MAHTYKGCVQDAVVEHVLRILNADEEGSATNKLGVGLVEFT